MISRVADHCFWFGRYMERAESTARVLSVTGNMALDAEVPPAACWQPVTIVSGEQAHFDEKCGAANAGDGEVVQRYMTWEEGNFTSIVSSVNGARENARSIREVVSLEVWETVNETHLWLWSAAARSEYEHHRYGFYRHLRRQAQLCLGLLRSTMLHDAPLDFIWLGMLLERSGQTARILDVHHHVLTTLSEQHQVVATALWLSLLRACSGFEPFMKRSQGRVSGDDVASFLLLEPRFPRSIRYCVHAAYERLCAIRPPEEGTLPGGAVVERLKILDRWLSEKTPGDLQSATIHDLLTQVVDEVSMICVGLGHELLGQPRADDGGAAPQ